MAALPDGLGTHVLWIGGPAGAGKTTAARLLARRRGLRWYNADTRTWEHRDRAIAAGVELPPRGPGQEFYDRRPMILDDLRAYPAAPLIVAEGGTITPAMAQPADQAVWLMPSRKAQRARLERRHPDGVPHGYLDSLDTQTELIEGAGVATVTVDEMSVTDVVDELERRFATRLSAGPTAASREERRALIREANDALVWQCVSPSTKPKRGPVDPGASLVVDCECAAADCVALIETTIGAAAHAVQSPPPSILADGHLTR